MIAFNAVTKRVVVVVDHEAWVHRALAAGFPSESVQLVACTTVRGGLNACAALNPDCVLAASELPDGPAIRLAKEREGASPLSQIPLVLLSEDPSSTTREALLRGGADAVLPKPFNVLDVVAQVRATIRTRARLRVSAGPAPLLKAELEGDLSQFSITSVLRLLSRTEQSGELHLFRSGSRQLVLELSRGEIVCGKVSAMYLEPTTALREGLKLDAGQFRFCRRPPTPAAHSMPLELALLTALSHEDALCEAPQSSGRPRESARSGVRAKADISPNLEGVLEPLEPPKRASR